MKRIALVVVLVFLVAGGVAVYWLLHSLDRMVREAIVRHGSEATGTAVSVEDVDIDLAGGRAAIRGLRVANPAGFSAEPAFALGEVEVVIDVRSLTGEPVVVDLVRVVAPRVRAEVDAQGDTNLERIRRHAAAARRRPAAEAGEAPRRDTQGEAEPARPEPRVRVRELALREGGIHVDARALDRGELDLTFPDVEVRDLGGEQGARPPELAALLAETLADRSARALAASEARRFLVEKLGEDVGGAVGEAVEKGIQGPVGDAVRGAIDRLRERER